MKWWVDTKRIKDVKPSVAEIKIIKILKNYNIYYEREVCFEGCESEKGFSLKFDFYFPEYNLLIEYDGSHHSEEIFIKNDGIKNHFAKCNKLTLIRLNKKNWFNLKTKINRILKRHTKKENINSEKIKILYDKEVIYPQDAIKHQRVKNKHKVVTHRKEKKLTRKKRALRNIHVTIDDYNRLYGKK